MCDNCYLLKDEIKRLQAEQTFLLQQLEAAQQAIIRLETGRKGNK